MEAFRKKFTQSYLADIKSILDSMQADLIIQIDKVASILNKARENRNTIFTMGNGGSAATASHFVIDLSKMTITEGLPRFKAIGLNDNIPSMLAWANDASYEDIFAEQLKNLMEPGDVVIGISGSGNSRNVIKAIEYANSHGAVTIGLSGFDGGKLLKCARENIHIPSRNMQRVEDIHLIIEHLLTSLLRDEKVAKLSS
jgi:D-sedoheptulose 7-phosphate isomerase